MQGELKEKRGKFNLPRDGSSLWVGKTKAFWNNKPGVITLRGARRGETRIERALPPLQTSGFQFRRPRYAFESRFNAIEDTIEWKSWFLNRLERGKKTSLLESSLERRNFSKCQSWRGGSSIRELAKGWRWITACSLFSPWEKKMEIRVQYICERKSKKDLKRKWDWKRKGWTDFFSKVLIVAN